MFEVVNTQDNLGLTGYHGFLTASGSYKLCNQIPSRVKNKRHHLTEISRFLLQLVNKSKNC